MLFLELSLSSELLAGEAGRPGNRLGLDPEDPVGLINWLEDSELFSDSGLKRKKNINMVKRVKLVKMVKNNQNGHRGQNDQAGQTDHTDHNGKNDQSDQNGKNDQSDQNG